MLEASAEAESHSERADESDELNGEFMTFSEMGLPDFEAACAFCGRGTRVASMGAATGDANGKSEGNDAAILRHNGCGMRGRVGLGDV